MHVREAILSRKTIQRYTTDPLPEGCIERALECAIRAPNHKLTNPWRFTLIGPQTRRRIVELGVQIKVDRAHAQGRSLSPDKLDALRAKLGNSPGLVVVSQVLTDDAFRRREDYASIACAIQHICLSLWNEGVGSKWATGAVTRHPDTYSITRVDPDVEEIVGFLWIGIAADEPDETPRRPVAEVTRSLP